MPPQCTPSALPATVALVGAFVFVPAAAWAAATHPELAPAAVGRLPTTVVSATASERDLAQVPASVSVVDGETLRAQPVGDLGDALEGTPGVDVGSVGLGRRGISIRGLEPGHTLILVDGQRLSRSGSMIQHSDWELGWVPAEAIERVEVVRGPMSSLYGSEALGGVVNVVTRQATDRWHGSLTGYGLLNGHGLGGQQGKTGFYLGGPLLPGRLGLSAWGEWNRRRALRDAENPGLTALARRRAASGHAGLTWTPDARQRVDASVDAGSEHQRALQGDARSGFYGNSDHVQRQRLVVSHSGRWSWGESHLRAYRTRMTRRNERSAGVPTGPNRFVDTVLDGRAVFNLGLAQRLTLGAEARRESAADPTLNARGHQALTHHALFVQDEVALGQRWDLTLSGRVDRRPDFGAEFSPRAYLLFHSRAGLTLKAGAGRGFAAPTLKQLSAEYESRAAMGGRGIIRGNPDLKPERAQSMELGAEYDGGRWSVGATVFENRIRNLIDVVAWPTCFELGKTCLGYENINRARLRGLELQAGARLGTNWRLEGSYGHLDARNSTSGERLASRSRHRANATLHWTPLPGLHARLRAQYTGTQAAATGRQPQPAYTLLHGYVDYALSRALRLSAGVENLTDKRLANDEAGLFARADEGRRYFVSLTAQF